MTIFPKAMLATIFSTRRPPFWHLFSLSSKTARRKKNICFRSSSWVSQSIFLNRGSDIFQAFVRFSSRGYNSKETNLARIPLSKIFALQFSNRILRGEVIAPNSRSKLVFSSWHNCSFSVQRTTNAIEYLFGATRPRPTQDRAKVLIPALVRQPRIRIEALDRHARNKSCNAKTTRRTTVFVRETFIFIKTKVPSFLS